MEENDKVYKLCKRTIKKWVRENYGTQEAEDPSWDIDSLSRSVASAVLRKISGEGLDHKQLTLLVRAGCDVQNELNIIDAKIRELGGRIIMKVDEGLQTLPFSFRNEYRTEHVVIDFDIVHEKVAPLSGWLNDREDILRYLLINKEERR